VLPKPKRGEPRRPLCVEVLAITADFGAGEGIRTLDPNLGKVVLLAAIASTRLSETRQTIRFLPGRNREERRPNYDSGAATRVVTQRANGGAGPFRCAISVRDIGSAFKNGWLFVGVVGALTTAPPGHNRDTRLAFQS
jgi:hypothetical protein